MKKGRMLFAAVMLAGCLLVPAARASALSHTVVSGDTMWKLAVRYQVGTSEIIQANPQIANPDLIYPGQVLQIPQLDSSVTAYEAEVIRLVNEIRQETASNPCLPTGSCPGWPATSPRICTTTVTSPTPALHMGRRSR